MRRAMCVGNGGPLRFAHDVQAQVDAGCGPRAREHFPVVHVQHVGVDLGQRVAPLQLLGVDPVRRAVPAVQKARCSKHESPGADAHDACTAVDRSAQRSQQRFDIFVVVANGRGGDHHQIRFLEHGQVVGHVDGEPHGRTDRAWLSGDDREVVRGQSLRGTIDTEDFAHHTELEWCDAVQQGDRDRAEFGHGQAFCHDTGRKSSYYGITATVGRP